MRKACRWVATDAHARGRQGAVVRRVGGQGSRPPAISIASRSSKAGPRAARASRKSSTSPGRATASPTSGPASCRRSAARSTSTKGTYTNSIGAVELKTVWTDPEFDPSVHAFYYARVLEIPTPRWTTIQAAQLGIAPPDVVHPTQQERAWSSPIWYTPTSEARELAKAGPTVDDLKKQGAVALNDAATEGAHCRKVPVPAEQRDRRRSSG